MKKLLLISIILFSIIKAEAQSKGGVLAGSNTFCDTLNSGFISVSGYVGTVTKWLYSTDGGINWASNSNTFSNQSYYHLKQSTCYKVVIKNGAFPPDTSTVACITIPTLTKGSDLTLNCITSDGTINVSSSTSNVTYSWTPAVVSGGNTNTAFVNSTGNYSCIVTETISGCTNTAVISVLSNTLVPNLMISSTSNTICVGQTATLTALSSNTVNYSWSPSTGLNSTTNSEVYASPTSDIIYTVTATDLTSGCPVHALINFNVLSAPILSIAINSSSICIGTSAILVANGNGAYNWNTGATTNSIIITPTISTGYTVTSTNTCGASIATITVIVDNTCQNVWPGDVNSDGIANNLDVLELGLHFAKTGAPRASTSNSWQPYFANDWTGTITNGKNLNHSDCNGDGMINGIDVVAIANNYNLTHVFKTAQTNTVNPQLSIVPDQTIVGKGLWGSASIYLGNATTAVSNINGVAFTINFDNTLIEPDSIHIDYQNSFMDLSNQNLDFEKQDFVAGKLFTATTHTVNNNMSGYGKIATLHYQISSNLTTDQVLNFSLVYANQSSASGIITSLTSGTGTLMANVTVGLQEIMNNNLISINPNPTNGLLTVTSKTELQKIEVITLTGQILMSEIPNGNNHLLHFDNFANGIYFVNLFQNNHIIKREKVIVNK